MNLRKKIFTFSLFPLLGVVTAAATLSVQGRQLFDLVHASEDCAVSGHVGYHYTASDAFKYNAGNEEFWTCCKCKRTFTETPETGSWTTRALSTAVGGIPSEALIDAPWVDCGHAGVSYLLPQGASNNDHSDDTYEHTETEATFVGTYNGGLMYVVTGDESKDRDFLEITMKGSGWKWNNYVAFLISVWDNAGKVIYQKPFQSADTSILNNSMTVFSEDGTQLTTIASINRSVYNIFRFDLREFLDEGRNIGQFSVAPYNNDKDNPKVDLSIKDVQFKSTLCGHSLNDYETRVVENAHEYQDAGTFVTCTKCGEVYSSVITEQAPWLRLEPNSRSVNYHVTEDGYSIVGGENGALYYTIPTNKSGRTILAVTLQSSVSTYEAFYLSQEGDTQFGRTSYQFFSPNNGFNFNKAPFVTDVIKDGYALQYDQTACTIKNTATYFPTGTEKVTYFLDLTSENMDESTVVKFSGVGASVSTTFSVDLREPDVLPGIHQFTWDNWAPSMLTKTSSSVFTVSGQASGTATIGNINKSNYVAANDDPNRPVVRMKAKMVKSLDVPTTAGNMQWYVKFNNEQVNFTNASATFANSANIHVTDLNGKLLDAGTKIPNNTWYYIEFNFDAEGKHIQFVPEGTDSWGKGYLLVEDFNVRLPLKYSSFAA